MAKFVGPAGQGISSAKFYDTSLVTYHPSLQAAVEYAREIKSGGATGVGVGTKPRGDKGWPVFATSAPTSQPGEETTLSRRERLGAAFDRPLPVPTMAEAGGAVAGVGRAGRRGFGAVAAEAPGVIAAAGKIRHADPSRWGKTAPKTRIAAFAGGPPYGGSDLPPLAARGLRNPTVPNGAGGIEPIGRMTIIRGKPSRILYRKANR